MTVIRITVIFSIHLFVKTNDKNGKIYEEIFLAGVGGAEKPRKNKGWEGVWYP
ncbi:hypothetical protein [Alloscardovia macacae]|uniref:hypothetical protein n=1 Tax=Alloscardovia macacae TaxID=1160091 RepID=UPI001313FB8A|nr:hypothetical protein [Alloscardovia macacae]